MSAALTGIAQAMRDSLDHNVLAPFSNRIGRSGFSRTAENIAFGHADFASTLDQWTNSAGHRANLLLYGAKLIGVADAQNGHRIYWAMVIGAKRKAISYADRSSAIGYGALPPRAFINVRFRGQNGHRKFAPSCPLVTQSGHVRLGIGAEANLNPKRHVSARPHRHLGSPHRHISALFQDCLLQQ
jgi:hypothetical protein